ncbi:hypothetical protein WMW72_07350 [Paenibacillus filicis]|uniref:Uncharacterized protein n=1 Tax=Paenibacillus filicis TaxID=669464 RepID=A0ABU9DFT3_9BACL
MEWYYPTKFKDSPVDSRSMEDMRVERLFPSEAMTDISYLAQYYCLSAVTLGTNTLIQIPINTDEAYAMVMTEIAPHFKDIRIISHSGQVTQINMIYIQEASETLLKQVIAEREVNSIAYDMFGQQFRYSDLPREIKITGWFSVDLSQIEKLVLDDNQQKLARFLKESDMTDGDSFGVYVSDWSLNDWMKQRAALRFLSTFCTEIQFAVNEQHRVTELRCFLEQRSA